MGPRTLGLTMGRAHTDMLMMKQMDSKWKPLQLHTADEKSSMDVSELDGLSSEHPPWTEL